MKFEHHSEPLISFGSWLKRLANSIWLAVIIIGAALSVGVLGYHMIANLGWVDAILEASMILGGMGAIAPMPNDAAKLFASAYALFSGLVLITTMGIILAPFLHRLMHQFHAPRNKH